MSDSAIIVGVSIWNGIWDELLVHASLGPQAGIFVSIRHTSSLGDCSSCNSVIQNARYTLKHKAQYRDDYMSIPNPINTLRNAV